MLPDFATVDWLDDEAVAIARALAERGVGVEAKLASPAAARAWAAAGLGAHTIRVVVPEPAQAEAVLGVVGDGVPAIVYAAGLNCWTAVRYALANGHGIRIGFEDTLELPDGGSPSSNAELVRTALALA